MTDANRPRFVDNLPAALMTIGLTGLASYSTIKALVQPRSLHGSILLLQFPGASSRSVIGINILLEIIFAALIVSVAVSVRSWERILVCAYSGLLFLTQSLYLMPSAGTAVRWIKVLCALLSFAAALMLFVQFQKFKHMKKMHDQA